MRAVADRIGADGSHGGPNTVGAAPVQVCLFGGLVLLKQGVPVAHCGGAKTEALLLSLAIHGTRGCSRERLLAPLWPDMDPLLASHSLRTLVHSLHKQLGGAMGDALPITHAGKMYRLNFEAGIITDLDRFAALARAGTRHWDQGCWSAARAAYQEAVALYRGDLRAGTDASARVERDRFQALYLVMLGRLADLARSEDDYPSALDFASLILRYDPGREDAHRTVMRCYARLGQRVQAMRQYLLCERVLQETFDAVPEPATRALYDRLRLEPETVLLQQEDLQRPGRTACTEACCRRDHVRKRIGSNAFGP
jgi:DNA-binding SARP family transcriptional activator